MKTVLAALALLACAADVTAGCPPRVRYTTPYYPHYYSSYYAQPSYQPAYTAAVSYQPVYQSAVAELVTPSVTTVTQFVPVQVAAFSAGFSPAVTAAAGTAVQGAAVQGAAVQGAAAPEVAAPAQPTNADLLKAIVGINDSLKNTDGRLQRLEAKVFGELEVVAPPDAPRDAPRAQPSPAPPPPVMPPAADPQGPRSALRLRGEQLAQAKCAACHDASTAARKGEGHVLFSGGRVAAGLAPALAAKAAARVKAKEMPPANPLNDSDAEAVAAAFLPTR